MVNHRRILMMSSANNDSSRRAAHNGWVAAMPATFIFLWSSGFIGAKYGLPYAEPFTFLGFRFLIVIVLMLLISFFTRAPWPTDAVTFFHIAVAGLLVHATYLAGVFSSVYHGLPVGILALITGLQPVLTGVFARHLLGEKVIRRQWIGIALGFLGVFLVVFDKLSVSEGDFTGIMFAGIALTGITGGTLYQKKYGGVMDLRSGSVIQFSASAIAIWILAWLFESMKVQWTGEFVFALSWLVLILSIGAISLLMLLIRKGAASKVASLFYLVPPVTALMSFAIFGETLGLIELTGMTIAVAGVALVTKA